MMQAFDPLTLQGSPTQSDDEPPQFYCFEPSHQEGALPPSRPTFPDLPHCSDDQRD